MEEIVSEVGSLEEILFAGHTGVVVKLSQAAVSCPAVQPGLHDAILQAFHTSEHPESCVPIILALLTYEVFNNSSNSDDGKQAKPHPFTLHGSLLLQALLKFEDTKVVARSLLKMSTTELVRACCDSQASHVLTTYLNSPSVPARKKEKLMCKLVVRGCQLREGGIFLKNPSFIGKPVVAVCE